MWVGGSAEIQGGQFDPPPPPVSLSKGLALMCPLCLCPGHMLRLSGCLRVVLGHALQPPMPMAAQDPLALQRAGSVSLAVADGLGVGAQEHVTEWDRVGTREWSATQRCAECLAYRGGGGGGGWVGGYEGKKKFVHLKWASHSPIQNVIFPKRTFFLVFGGWVVWPGGVGPPDHPPPPPVGKHISGATKCTRDATFGPLGACDPLQGQRNLRLQ